MIDNGCCPEVIVNVAAAEVAPPGFTTVRFAAPAATMRLVVTDAVSFVGLINVVVSAVPFHLTAAPEANPWPLTVSVNAGPPAVAENGLRPEMTGVVDATVIVTLLLVEALLRVSPLYVAVSVWLPAARLVALNV